MGIKRRSLLIGGLGLLGMGGTLLARSAFERNATPATQSKLPDPAIASAKSKAIAPSGLYAPLRGDVRIAVISDLNSQYGSTDYEPEVDKAIAMLPDWQPDLVLCGGDMVAGQKRSLSKPQIEAMWAGFDRHIAAPLRKAKLPFGFTIGNHDGSGSISQGKFTFQADRDLAQAYWTNTAHKPGLTFVEQARFPFYYSFAQNNVFYLVWDASTDRIDPAELTWAEKSLASPLAQQAKLRIVIGHLPLYAVAKGRETAGNYLAQGDQLRSLLERYQVHTYISGHHHAYFPGKKGHLQLLHTGALGSGPRPLLDSPLPPRKTLTIVDVDLAQALTRYTTYDMQTLQVVDIQTLPKVINSPTGKIWRRDIEVTEN